MAEEAEPLNGGVTYADLAAIEDEFEKVDVEIMRRQYALSASAYAKRAEFVAKIPSFWPLVLEQAPMEIDQYIQPHDSRVFAESLVSVSVSRPELDAHGEAGNPRTLRIRFEFQPNDDFADEVLEKTFWHRRTNDGWTGLVSEPVKVHWKPGRDLSEGLTDMSCALWEARRKKGDMLSRDVPEYKTLKKQVESWNGMNTSIFTWFGWVSGRRWVSAEESAAAEAKHRADAQEQGEEEVEYDPSEDDSAVEVHEGGEDLAISIAEELWPNATKFFTQAQESDLLSDAEFEDGSDEEGEGEEVDIAELVGQPGAGNHRSRDHSDGPPSKKPKSN